MRRGKGGPAGLGSWTANAEPHRRPSDTTTHESGSLLRTLVMRRLALCQPTGKTTSVRHAMSQLRYVGRDAERSAPGAAESRRLRAAVMRAVVPTIAARRS